MRGRRGPDYGLLAQCVVLAAGILTAAKFGIEAMRPDRNYFHRR